MRQKIALILLFISFSALPLCQINAQTTSSAGFVTSNNIWYSENSFTAGDNVSIYTLVFNPEDKELTGTVVFFDDNTILDTKNFTVTANGVQKIQINWTATAGSHTIFGRIENAKFLISDKTYEDAYLAQNETEKSSINVSVKIVSKTTSTGSGTNSNSDNSDEMSSDVIQSVKNAIPAPISKSVDAISNTVETFRKNLGTYSENKKEDFQKQINGLNTPTSTNNNSQKTITAKKPTLNSNQNGLLKPLKYMGLFFYTLCSFIFNNKFLFYGIITVLLFLILRLIWLKIF